MVDIHMFHKRHGLRDTLFFNGWKNKPLFRFTQSVASDSLFRLNIFFNFFCKSLDTKAQKKGIRSLSFCQKERNLLLKKMVDVALTVHNESVIYGKFITSLKYYNFFVAQRRSGSLNA